MGLRMNVIRGCPDYYHGVIDDGVAEGRPPRGRAVPGGDARRVAVADAPLAPGALRADDPGHRRQGRSGRHGELGLRAHGPPPGQRRALRGLGPRRLLRQGRAGPRRRDAHRRERGAADRRRRARDRRARDAGRAGPVHQGPARRRHRGQQLRAGPATRLQQDAGQPGRPGVDALLDDRRRELPPRRPLRCPRRARARGHRHRHPRARRGGRGGPPPLAQHHADHRPAPLHRRQPPRQALRQRGLLPGHVLHDRHHRRRDPDAPQLPLLDRDRQPGAREVRVRLGRARPGLARGARGCRPTRSRSSPRRPASTPTG